MEVKKRQRSREREEVKRQAGTIEGSRPEAA
jgi:hypothetical protein